MDDKTQRGRPTAAPLLSKWDYWRVSWLTLACTIIKLVTFARWLPQWDTWWKMAVLEKRTNDREAARHERQGNRGTNAAPIDETITMPDDGEETLC